MRRRRAEPLNPDAAQTKLEALCAASERCSSEILTKLHGWGIHGAEASAIIDSLAKGRFIDDERFAHAFVVDKYRFARWGRIKIRAALYAKKIPTWMIDEAMDEIDDTEYADNLMQLLRAKRTALREEASTYEGRTKIFRYGASRGYELPLIASLIRDPRLWHDDR